MNASPISDATTASMSTTSLREETLPGACAKREQILDGARRRFLAVGFEAASMETIAREAGVSKGTLYVYFPNKEALFIALVEESKRQTAEHLTALDPAGAPEEVLTRYAVDLITRLLEPEHIALVRMVVGVADRIPAPAQSFFEAGPVAGARRIAAYFAQLVAAGRLDMPDVEAAAWQFLSLCTHPVMVRTLMAADREPTAEVITAHARRSAAMIFAAYPLGHAERADQAG